MLAQTSHGASDADEVAQKQLEQTGLQAIIAKMRGVQARGRICIKLAKPEELEKSPYDIEIEDGDTLFIQLRNNNLYFNHLARALYNLVVSSAIRSKAERAFLQADVLARTSARTTNPAGRVFSC